MFACTRHPRRAEDIGCSSSTTTPLFGPGLVAYQSTEPGMSVVTQNPDRRRGRWCPRTRRPETGVRRDERRVAAGGRAARPVAGSTVRSAAARDLREHGRGRPVATSYTPPGYRHPWCDQRNGHAIHRPQPTDSHASVRSECPPLAGRPGRGVPDVAGSTDPQTGYQVLVHVAHTAAGRALPDAVPPSPSQARSRGCGNR